MTLPRPSNGPPVVLVVGLGNTLRGDDALGPIVAERVSHRVDASRVKVLVRSVLTPDLAADVAAVQRVLVLDAAINNERAGVDIQRLFARKGAPSMAHSLEFADILALARDLYDGAPECFLITSPGETFELRDQSLGRTATAAVQPMTDAALRLVEMTALSPSSCRPV